MRDDLLAARASVDWAVAQLPAFQSRLDAWLKGNIDVVVKELPAPAPTDVILAREKESLPLAFQVEAGAYINTIRSSLDILAATLAQRHCPALVGDCYFPIVSSAEIFATERYKGHKLIRSLPAAERATFESLKPYKGGNHLLYALHLLDIVRKHRRLLTAEIHPAKLRIEGSSSTFRPVVHKGWMRSGDDETVIAFLAKGAPMPQIKLVMQVSINEPTYLEHQSITEALSEFANLANSIIARFAD